jgi:hypothetical protein
LRLLLKHVANRLEVVLGFGGGELRSAHEAALADAHNERIVATS